MSKVYGLLIVLCISLTAAYLGDNYGNIIANIYLMSMFIITILGVCFLFSIKKKLGGRK